MRLIPNEIVRKNIEHASNSSTTREHPLFKILNGLTNNLYVAPWHMNATHIQTRWPLALCLPNPDRTRIAFMNVMHEPDVISDAHLDRITNCNDRAIDIIMRPDNTMLQGSLIWLRHEGYERLNGIELMLTMNKGASAQVYKKDKHVICYIGGNNYPGFVRFCATLPLIYGETLNPEIEALMLTWIRWAESKMDDNEFTNYLENAPFLEELRRQVQLNELRTQIDARCRRDVVLLQEREENMIASMHQMLVEYGRQHSEYLQNMDSLRGARASVETRTSKLQEFLDILLHNIYVKKITFTNNTLTIAISAPLQHYNEDAMRIMVEPGKKFGDSPQREQYTALFLSGDYQLWLCANIDLPLFGSPVHAHYAGDNKPEWGLPNKHLEKAHCLGNNGPQIMRAVQQEDYMLMLSYCISSVGNINLYDSTIWKYFEAAIGGDSDYAAVEDTKTKERFTLREFRARIERQRIEAERAATAVHDNAGRTGVDTEQGPLEQGNPDHAAQPATPGEQTDPARTPDRGAVPPLDRGGFFEEDGEDNNEVFTFGTAVNIEDIPPAPQPRARRVARPNDDITEAVAQTNREVEDETN